MPKTGHPPYSTDLDPCDFWLFLKLKNDLKGQRFTNIQEHVTALLKGIPENIDFLSIV